MDSHEEPKRQQVFKDIPDSGARTLGINKPYPLLTPVAAVVEEERVVSD